MHNNYYFLRKLSGELEKILAGTVISECYSQSKEEIIIRFETHEKPFHIKGNFSPALSMISFPERVERARKNSVDLFPEIIGHRITGIRQFKNERSFALELEEGKLFLFKMHANRSNALLIENEKVISLFRNNLPQDNSVDVSSLDRKIDWSYDAFIAHQSNLTKLYFTFGKIVWSFLEEKNFESLSIDDKWSMIQNVVQQLENPSFYQVNLKNSLHFSLLPLKESSVIKGNALEAANNFFYTYTQGFVLDRQKTSTVANLRHKLNASQSYYEKNFQKLTEIESDTNYKNWADLIMANMHDLKQGMEKISLRDFYHEDQFIEIKLKKELSPQHNAALFYKKAKNQHIEIERLQQSLEMKEKEIEKIKKEIQEIEEITDIKELRKKVQNSGISNSSAKQNLPLPYHEFEMNGFRIWVGRNAEGNDKLTLKHAYKEDLWLHAKDVSGSHVIIKYQSGKKFPKDVIERAAQLAAYNSKRKNESLCPVIVTPKKFVRKRKGDQAGAVVVEREDIIMVEPKL